MNRAIFVYNPLSGGQNVPQRLDYIISRFQEKKVLLQPYRLLNDSGENLAKIIKENKFSFIIASGGDGTLNFVSNVLLKNNIKLPLGVIPAGTCNDFAGILGIPPILDECLDIIIRGKTTSVDVGLINDDSYFLSSFAGGVFVDVSFNTHSELKKNLGPFAYYLKAISEVGNIKPFKLKIEADNETFEEEVLLFFVLNGKNAGGFSNIIKEADISDGLMDIVLIKSCNHIDLASIFFKVLSNDDLIDRNVSLIRSRKCKIIGDKDIVSSVDGEKGPVLPVSIKFINKAIEVYVK